MPPERFGFRTGPARTCRRCSEKPLVADAIFARDERSFGAPQDDKSDGIRLFEAIQKTRAWVHAHATRAAATVWRTVPGRETPADGRLRSD
ncbi:MAG: hypothetical protein AVDCRST_MAG64-2766 [uncultured Phycisphaerae bacterium]|uniref:Uncharacterized protein n=1 Tax=uncultured Phycisphaerae bacterium TaxID=904963 RepID=A0A6J4PTH2_9BACT|nr:MAG: hypothetical protein AVDCRST_MAG64-2766 [uncultured Phycisphaerae bacterium]